MATRNKPVCGCIGPGFIQNAKRNHYCALVHAGNSPDKYRETMLALGRYHSKDMHDWEGGSCTFHPLVKCSCKNCEADVDGFYSELKCSGEDYHSAHILTCEFHALAYEIECTQRAKDAEKVIDPELGKGHSNLPESTFSVLTKFRGKIIFNAHVICLITLYDSVNTTMKKGTRGCSATKQWKGREKGFKGRSTVLRSRS